MAIDIHLAKDREELAAARAAVADALKACEGFAPQLADKAVDAVMAALFGHFGHARVYFPGDKTCKGRVLPDELQRRIELRLLAGEGCTAIAKDLKVGRRSVHRIRERMAQNTALVGVLGDAS